MNHKILIIIAREYTTRVRKKSFIILTLLMPFLMAALIAVPLVLGMIKDDSQQDIAIVDNTHRYISCFEDTERFHFCSVPTLADSMRTADSPWQAVVVINDELSTHPNAATIYSREEIQLELRQAIEEILEAQIRAEKLAAYNIPELENIIDDVQEDFTIQTVKWSDDGSASLSSSDVAMAVGFTFTFLIYMFVMSYGGMVMAGVTEEKSNRIIEVMVSSVKPFHLMMGKIFGVLLVGLTQMLIWGVLLGAILAVAGIAMGNPATIAEAAGSASQSPAPLPAEALGFLASIPMAEILVMFVLNFVGGYMLYASIFAACGAAVDNQEDSSQFMMPIVILMIFSLYAAMGSVENTNGPLAFWTSLFPFTSPIVMMVRIPFGVPLWQEILSVGILFATATTFVWVGARIYRVGILMYGKKPTPKELWKWIRYK